MCVHAVCVCVSVCASVRVRDHTCICRPPYLKSADSFQVKELDKGKSKKEDLSKFIEINRNETAIVLLDLIMNWSWGEEGEYDEEPSVDYMEYLARRASCSVLPDPPKAMVYLYNGCCCCMLLTFFTEVETHTRERQRYILSPQCIIVHDND